MINVSEILYFLKGKAKEVEIGIENCLMTSIDENSKRLKNEFKKVSLIKRNNLDDNSIVKEKEIIITIENSVLIVGKINIEYVYRDGKLSILNEEHNLSNLRYADLRYFSNGIVYEKLSSLLNSIRKEYKTVYNNDESKDYIKNFYDNFYKVHFIDYLRRFVISNYKSMLIVVNSNSFAVEFLSETMTPIGEPRTQFDMLGTSNYVDFENLNEIETFREFRKILCDKDEYMKSIREEIDEIVENDYRKYFDEEYDNYSIEKQEELKEILKYELFRTEIENKMEAIEELYDEENKDYDDIEVKTLNETVFNEELEKEYKTTNK